MLPHPSMPWQPCPLFFQSPSKSISIDDVQTVALFLRVMQGGKCVVVPLGTAQQHMRHCHMSDASNENGSQAE
jgi:hypothetical protein